MSECKRCEFKRQCLGSKSSQKSISRHIYQETLDKVAVYLKTSHAQESIKERKMYAEWAIAEAKTLHGLRRTRFRGKWKVSIQALLTASVQNIKRLVKHYESRLSLSAQQVRTFREKLLLSPVSIFENFAFCLS